MDGFGRNTHSWSDLSEPRRTASGDSRVCSHRQRQLDTGKERIHLPGRNAGGASNQNRGIMSCQTCVQTIGCGTMFTSFRSERATSSMSSLVTSNSDRPQTNRPSLKKNVIANYIGQFYGTILGIVMVPIYLQYLGREAYGLVGFFGMLTGWLQLLDLGLAGTLARETAAFRGGAIDHLSFQRLFKVLDRMFLCFGLIVGFIIVGFSGLISRNWIRSETLAPEQLTAAVALMGIIFAIRWPTGIRRSVIVGLEKQVWLNIINIISATIRHLGVFAVFHWLGATPKVFFGYQLLISLIEFVAIYVGITTWLPQVSDPEPLSLAPLRRVFRFSISIAITTSIWVFVTQTDKLILSNLLPLSDYACFSIVLTVASAVSLITGPLIQGVQPRLTQLCTSGNEEAFRSLYLETTRSLTAIAIPVAGTLAIASQPLLLAWTKDPFIANKAAPVLALYSLGYALLSVSAVTYFLQCAKGDLSLHLKGTTILSSISILMVIFGTIRWGMVGAGAVFLGTQIFSFSIWTAIVHRHFAPGLHLPWLKQSVIFPAMAGSIPNLALFFIPWNNFSRFPTLTIIGLTASAGIFCAGLTTQIGRSLIENFSKRWG